MIAAYLTYKFGKNMKYNYVKGFFGDRNPNDD
jgi:hypothetical protein